MVRLFITQATREHFLAFDNDNFTNIVVLRCCNLHGFLISEFFCIYPVQARKERELNYSKD